MKSGRASFNLLYNKNDLFFLFDENKDLQLQLLNEFCFHLNVFVLKNLSEIVLDGIDEIIISPSISIFDKRIVLAKKKGIEILSELELGFSHTKNKFIAVTGTNGKTTTVNLIYQILKNAGKRVELVGNVGIPLCEKVKNEKHHTTYVCEVSSFQLEAVKTFKPKIACLLNISPDHLDRHKTMKNYLATKKKIFKNMNKNDFVVLNEKLKMTKTKCKTYMFGTKKTDFGCYLDKNDIIYSKKGKENFICDVSTVSLKGFHNIENVMCAVCVSKILGVKNKTIKRTLKNFSASKHKIEKVFEKNGIEFFDDSKGTNVDATICAMKTLCNGKNSMLILGGKDKGDEFDKVFTNLTTNIQKILVVGEAKEKILIAGKRANCFDKLLGFDSLKDAVEFACENLKSGEQLLLSPACSSFDEFKDYVDRGQKFLEYIKGYYEKF